MRKIRETYYRARLTGVNMDMNPVEVGNFTRQDTAMSAARIAHVRAVEDMSKYKIEVTAQTVVLDFFESVEEYERTETRKQALASALSKLNELEFDALKEHLTR